MRCVRLLVENDKKRTSHYKHSTRKVTAVFRKNPCKKHNVEQLPTRARCLRRRASARAMLALDREPSGSDGGTGFVSSRANQSETTEDTGGSKKTWRGNAFWYGEAVGWTIDVMRESLKPVNRLSETT